MLAGEDFRCLAHVQSTNWIGEAQLETDARLEVRLAGREWFSDRYSAVDPYALVFYAWGKRRELPVGDLKNYTAFKDRMLQRPAVRDGRIGKAGGFIARLAPPLGAWTAWRDARPIAPRSFREQWRDSNSGSLMSDH